MKYRLSPSLSKPPELAAVKAKYTLKISMSMTNSASVKSY